MKPKPKISIIGNGRMAKALACAFQGYGCIMDNFFIRNPIKEHELQSFNVPVKKLTKNTVIDSDIVFLAVSDDAISDVASQIVTNLNGLLVHTSGALNLDCLQPAKESGWRVASFHPIQTIPEQTDRDLFQNVTVSILSGKDETSQLAELAVTIGATPLPVSESDKIRLHIAAVFLSNYVVSLVKTAEDVLKNGQIDTLKTSEIFTPLLRNAVEQVLITGTNKSLTGPVSRGDTGTIKKHKQQLQDDNAILTLELYQTLGRQALEVKRRDGRLSDEEVRRVKDALS